MATKKTINGKTNGKAKAAEKTTGMRVLTPVGIILFPHLVEPNTKGEYATNKYQLDIMFPKASFNEAGKELRKAVLTVGRSYFGDQSLKLSDFKNPFKDGDEKKQEYMHGHIIMTPKSEYKVTVVGPDKNEFSSERIRSIKGGDLARLVVNVYPYAQQGGGVTCGLNVVQFYKEGDAIGGGVSKSLEMLDEMEIEMEDIDTDEGIDDDDDASDDDDDDVEMDVV